MKLTAKEAQALIPHKDDVMFGVRERVYHQIQVAALSGQCGCSFNYRAEYDGYWETEMFIQELIDSGYEVIDKGVYNFSFDCPRHLYEVYWAV